MYGFCPGKVRRDHEAAQLFELMVVAAETRLPLVAGGLADQPDWFVSMLAWFAPAYDMQKFIGKARMILGDGQQTKATKKP